MYSNAISQLYNFNKVSSRLSFIYGEKEDYKQAKRAMSILSKKSSLLREKQASNNELSTIADSLVEILKASFLIEPLMLYHVTGKINQNKKSIAVLFEYVGFIDACISISTLRKNSNVSIPKTTKERILKTKDCYHPLINNPVVNTIEIDETNSILISGSNMSGKTTFIRTLGVNAYSAKPYIPFSLLSGPSQKSNYILQ